MPRGEDPIHGGHSTPSHDLENHRKEIPRPSSSMSIHENSDYATFRYDELGKEKGESHLRVASLLEEKLRARSTSPYDPKQTGDFPQERRENRMSEDKKKQIDQG